MHRGTRVPAPGHRGLGQVSVTGVHLVGSVDEEEGSAGPRPHRTEVCVCPCVSVHAHVRCVRSVGVYARMWYVYTCTCV